MSSLMEYVESHAQRGACRCGKCVDAPDKPEDNQPPGHTADMIFFKVAKVNHPTKEEFLQRVRTEYPQWLDNKEHSYLELGADMGDQGVALKTMALGYLVGAWKLYTPKNMIPDIDDAQAMRMAGVGLITVKLR